MAEDDDKQNKTEEPSEQKLKKARKKGDVPSSREAGNMMSTLALCMITLSVLPTIGSQLAGALAQVFEAAGRVEIGDSNAGLRDIGQVVRQLASGIGAALAPVAGLLVLAAVVGVLIQGETVVATDRITPKLSKLSPIAGFKRIFSLDAFVEFAKNIAKVAAVAAIAFYMARRALAELWQAEGVSPSSLLFIVTEYVGLLLAFVATFLVAVAVADILWKRFQWLKKQKMSIKELRDEHKESEGDPQIRARREGLRRARAKQRLASAVPRATLILTNPTHYAVALRYELGVDRAPVCVAKGTDLTAARIRKLAREHDVPIVENRPLARALHAVAEVDQEIPLDHWQAVAEIIGYLMDLRRNISRKLPDGSTLRHD